MKLKILEFANRLEDIKSNLETKDILLKKINSFLKPKYGFSMGFDFNKKPLIKTNESEIEFLKNIILEFKNTFKEYFNEEKITEKYLLENGFNKDNFQKYSFSKVVNDTTLILMPNLNRFSVTLMQNMNTYEQSVILSNITTINELNNLLTISIK